MQITLANCYYMLAGKCLALGENQNSISVSDGCIVALKISTRSGLTDTLAVYASLAALKTAQEDLDWYIIPLYQIAVNGSEGEVSVGSVTFDFRNMPNAGTWERLS
ncbi:MAG: hypothetical protein IKO64_03280 [Kiritimatiellae bacterium]|nr:hypothetical protein [Kiritimatiellia bacterium]